MNKRKSAVKDLPKRFSGARGRKLLLEALKGQQSVQGDALIARKLSRCVTVFELSPGQLLIEQDGFDNDLFFVLAGAMRVTVYGRDVAVRTAGQHVGEMAMIDPSAKRSASVAAKEISIVAKITERDFSSIAQEHPTLWRRLALELGDRLRQRNRLITPPNVMPSLFIGSSSESLPIVQAIQSGLSHDHVTVKTWTDGIFSPSSFVIEDIEREASVADFGVLVVNSDDKVHSRGKTKRAPRDNVVFELGLFMGAIGRKRTFLVKPRGLDVKIPSDLLGVTPIEFTAGDKKDLDTLIAPVCNKLRKAIANLGCK